MAICPPSCTARTRWMADGAMPIADGSTASEPVVHVAPSSSEYAMRICVDVPAGDAGMT